ncbi:MAG: hypothetical protein AABW59_02000 [archaeon]
MDPLLFAQTFPFSERAKQKIKESNLNLGNVGDNIVRRAALMVSRAHSQKQYALESTNPSKEQLETETFAFPIAKIFASLLKAPNMPERFSSLIKKNTFSALMDSKSTKELCLELADDFALKYELSQDKEFFVVLTVLDYLQIRFTDDEMKLVNKAVEGGKVYLNLNDFARFLSEKAYVKVFDSLPIPKDAIPEKFVLLARSIDSQLTVIGKKEFDLKIEGKMDPNLFPPCMKLLYADQLAGKKLSYTARLSLASFLFQLGMTKTEMMALLAKSPDFKQHIAQYHVERIFEKQLSAPGCKKIAEYGLRMKECDKECRSVHPLKYYMRMLRVRNRTKNEQASTQEKQKQSAK